MPANIHCVAQLSKPKATMGLTEYMKKRTFGKTPEPTGGKPKGGKLSFVIQKHAASRLHYDFRLELDGALLSWAIPKGPSLNPADKRLAMHVEDHPFDYKDFEGIIPEGNYGAGTVIIWDEGTYEPAQPAKTKKANEEIIRNAYQKGTLKFRLYGEKLQGEFALVRMKGRGDDSWLLIKHRDDFSSRADITGDDQSVRSGRTLEDMAASEDVEYWKSNRKTGRTKRKGKRSSRRPAKIMKPPLKNRRSEEAAGVGELLDDMDNKFSSPIPKDLKPMLATLVDKPFDEAGWMYEVKWDGFRAIAYMDGGEVNLRSRNNKDFAKKFYPVFRALQEWAVNAVVDGEVVVIDEKGKPDFNALQQWRSEADGNLVYYVFDVLWLEGYDLMKAPLSARRKVLESMLPESDVIRLSETFSIRGTEFFELADSMGLEGVFAKRRDSEYTPDTRSRAWVKIKTERHQEAIIAGYTRNQNSPKPFSALLMGVYNDDGELVFIGPVGTGFTASLQKELVARMKTHETKVCPFRTEPDYNKPSRFRPNPPKADVVWLEPKLVAEIAYRSSGGRGGLRHPSFRGLRDDKAPAAVRSESPVPVDDVVASHDQQSRFLKPMASTRRTLLNPTEKTQVRRVDDFELKFTNLDKVYWPDEGYTKRDMLNYYYQVAPLMLPYMMDRPQTLNRFPNGIKGQSFYQKDVTGKVPDWVETYRYFSEGDKREKHFMVCTNEAGLLYMASLGCIELNPWSSRTDKPDHPDWCVIDLDPGDQTSFDQVIEAALVTRDVLDTLEVSGFCKTSGSTGLHIYIPLGAKYTYEDSKEFARSIARIVHSQLPRFTTIDRKLSDRGGRMYIDFLQNRPQATLAGPYALRPKPGAPVSTPLHWDEVKKGLRVLDFTIANVIDRFKETGDLFQGVLGEGIDLEKAVSAIDAAFQLTTRRP